MSTYKLTIKIDPVYQKKYQANGMKLCFATSTGVGAKSFYNVVAFTKSISHIFLSISIMIRLTIILQILLRISTSRGRINGKSLLRTVRSLMAVSLHYISTLKQ